MVVMVKKIIASDQDSLFIFKDPTGEIQGTVHRKVLEEQKSSLSTGSAVALSNVTIFRPSTLTQHLIVTPENVTMVLPPD
mmetsp:Transcript_19017/g.31177  ORF Transcript_19017/g.31177 Transcript_19017/m.31177 type:complete len:80 (+) Transcript_19017:370-609(+)